MAATLSVSMVDAASGNVLTLPGTGLTAGSGASVALASQGVNSPPGLTQTSITLPAVFNGTNVVIGPLPDGITSGLITVTASDATSATCALRAVSQYIQYTEYLGEGEDTSSLTISSSAPYYSAGGELDAILRKASALADAVMGKPVRVVQEVESQKYKPNKHGPPVIRPYRCRGRKCPIQSVDQLVFISAKDLVTVFNLNDIYVNTTLDYSEVLAYAVGNFALLGELQIIGYSANVWQIAYTSGYYMATYPAEVRLATMMTATALLNRRKRQKMGMGAFAKFQDKLTVDPSGIQVPIEARALLAPYRISTLS